MEIDKAIGSEVEAKTKKFFAELKEGSDNMPATKEASKPKAQAKTKKVTKTTKAKTTKAKAPKAKVVDTNVVEEMLEGGAETPQDTEKAVRKITVMSKTANRDVENAKAEAAKVFTPTVINAKRPKGASTAILKAIQNLPNGGTATIEIHESVNADCMNTEYDIIWVDGPIDWPTIACGGGDVTAHKPYDAKNTPTFASLLGDRSSFERWYCEPISEKTLSVIWTQD